MLGDRPRRRPRRGARRDGRRPGRAPRRGAAERRGPHIGYFSHARNEHTERDIEPLRLFPPTAPGTSTPTAAPRRRPPGVPRRPHHRPRTRPASTSTARSTAPADRERSVPGRASCPGSRSRSAPTVPGWSTSTRSRRGERARATGGMRVTSSVERERLARAAPPAPRSRRPGGRRPRGAGRRRRSAAASRLLARYGADARHRSRPGGAACTLGGL